MNGTNLSCCEVAAAMAMVAVRTEPHAYALGFTNSFVDLGITAKDTIEAAARKAQKANFGTTDCAVAFEYARREKLEVDAFCIYTDCETYAGPIQPSQALQKYRNEMGRPAKSIVIGLTATAFTIADPNDPGMLDIAGFDAAMPQIISGFVK